MNEGKSTSHTHPKPTPRVNPRRRRRGLQIWPRRPGFSIWRLVATFKPPKISVDTVLVARVSNKAMFVPIELESEQTKSKKTVATNALLDSGAGGIFLDQTFAQKHKLPLHPLETPIAVYNVDGSRNSAGTITHGTHLNLKIADYTKPTEFYVTGLGQQTAILGFPWLKKENPDINWDTGTISLPETQVNHLPTEPITVPLTINAKTLHSITFAKQYAPEETAKPLKEMVPQEYHEYLDIFSETTANRFPASRPWDHKIELKEGFQS